MNIAVRLPACALLLGLAVCYGQSTQPLSLISPTLPAGTIGVPYSAQYTGAGGFPAYFFSIATGTLPPGLALNSTSGLLAGTPTTNGTFNFIVQVFDNGENSASSPLQTIVIAPPLNLSAPSLPNGTVGLAYPPASYTGTGGTPPYFFSIATGTLPPGLGLNSTSGLLAGTPTTPGTFAFVVRLSDSRQTTVLSPTQAITIISAIVPLTILPSSLPQGMVAVPYSSVPIVATGGTPPYSWSVTGGTLPPGLSLSSSGNLSGTPSSAGLFAFTATVTDSARAAQTASASFQISISQAVSVVPPVVPPGTVGTPYKPVQFSTNLSSAGLSFAISGGALPPGLTFTSAGVLSGTPTQAGTFAFTVAVSGQFGSGSTVVTMVVFPALFLPPITIPDISPNFPINIPIGQPTGGVPPYTSALSGCSIPGITLTSAGVLLGSATTPGSYACTLTVTDSAGATASTPATIKVLPFLVITTTSVPPGTIFSSYPATSLTATGGKPPYTWSLAGGSLPPGLTLNSSGTISGTPTSVGAFTFSVQVQDVPGAKTAASFSITVSGGPAIGPAQFPDGTVNTAYPSVALTVTGGTQPYTFTSTGSLPPGLTLSSGGTVSGTPTQAGSFTFTIQVTDANKLTATSSYTINIGVLPLTITTTSLPQATAFTPYSQTFTASGGTSPYTFRVASGTLPAGLSLAPNGLLSGTPATNVTASFTIQVTDSGRVLQTASRAFMIPITVPPVSTGAVQNVPDRLDAAQQQSFGFSLQSGYPADIKGVLTLTFVSSAVVPSTDPALKFTNGDTKIGFTIPATKTDAIFDTMPLFSTGMVAGTITLTASLTAAGIDLIPTPIPSRTIVVSPAPPVINSVTATNSNGQLTLVIQGFATTRQVTQAKFHFDTVSSDITVDVGSAFTQWYQSQPSVAFGSSFTYTQPFTVQGALSGSVTVTLVNDRGSSNAKSAQF